MSARGAVDVGRALAASLGISTRAARVGIWVLRTQGHVEKAEARIRGEGRSRALIDPDQATERPIQILGSDYRHIDEWANQSLKAGGPNSYVEFYETTETKTGFRRRSQS